MTQLLRTFGYGVTSAAIFALILISGGAANAQQDPAADQLLSPEQLDDLVAPIALYPDPLISQVLVASTYPLEIVEASQWLQRNPNMSGTALTQAAVKQDWDPSIQALVVFPDVLKYLMEDIAWTTNLGNAFLIQEGDVMDAIQRMRDRAARLGKLQTTPEQQVIHVIDNGQPVYEIIPTNPTVIYVPVYDPYYIWGSALYYPYPRWYYPAYANHVYFSRGIYIDAYYGSGWYGSISYGPTYRAWNSWGWRPAWNNRTVVVNNVFIDNHYYNASRPRSVSGTTASWSHDASHRRGVIYPNTVSYDRYRRDPRDVPRPQLAQGQNRNAPAQVATRSVGSTNNSRQGERTDGRLDTRQDVRPDTRQAPRTDTRTDSRQVTRQDARPEPRQDTRTDTRAAGRDSSPNSSNRDTRVDSTTRTDRGNSSVNTNRTAPAQVAASLPTHVTPAQVTLERQAANSAPDMSRQRGPAQDQVQASRNSQNAGASVTRQSPGQSREAPAARSAAPSVSQASISRQSAPSRSAAPEVRSSPSQQQAPRSSVSQGSQGSQRSQPSQMAQAAPRQSAPDRSVSAESRRAPSSQAAPSSSGQSGRSSNGNGNGGSSNGGGSNGSSHGSNGGGNGGGNSKGRR